MIEALKRIYSFDNPRFVAAMERAERTLACPDHEYEMVGSFDYENKTHWYVCRHCEHRVTSDYHSGYLHRKWQIERHGTVKP